LFAEVLSEVSPELRASLGAFGLPKAKTHIACHNDMGPW